jgi:tetratricopeptide (TPR) repeat protein
MKSLPSRPLLAAALLLLTFLVYHAAPGNGFVWDDDLHLTRNATMQDAEGLRDIWFRIGATPQYYPLSFSSFWVEHRIWGLRPAGYHAINILLHALSGVLIWRLLCLLRVRGAWVVAAVFLVHPVAVESVAWISERKNVLSGVFYLGSALLYLRFALGRDGQVSRPYPGRGYYLALALFACALLSKTATLTLPPALLLVLWWKRRLDPRQARLLTPFLLLGIVMGLATLWIEQQVVGAQGVAWSLTVLERFLLAGRALWFYAGKVFWPHPVVFQYPRWEIDAGQAWQYLYPLAALALVGSLWGLRHRLGRGPLVAVLFFGGTLFPALGFFEVYYMQYSYVADHFQYLASLGLIALGVAGGWWLASRLGRWRAPVGVAATVAVLAVLGVLAARQVPAYANTETLWRDTLAKNPEAWMAQYNLGHLRQMEGDLEGAVTRYEIARSLQPAYAAIHTNLGTCFYRLGRIEEAVASYRTALELEPESPTAHFNLGLILRSEGRLKEAIEQFRMTVKVWPGYEPAQRNLGTALEATGRFEEAAPHLEIARRLREQEPPG